jgi:hypothetical protein
MHCAACDLALADDDNYCRRCGASVRVVAVAAPERAVEPAGTTALSLLAGASRPLATGAAAVVAGALVRFAVRRAARGLVDSTIRRAARPAPRAVTPHPSVSLPDGVIQVTEMLWVRRVMRTDRS